MSDFVVKSVMWLTTVLIVNLLTMLTTAHIDRDRSTNYFETGLFADLKGVSHECKVVYECQVTFELTPSYLVRMPLSYECQKRTHETYKRIKILYPCNVETQG